MKQKYVAALVASVFSLAVVAGGVMWKLWGSGAADGGPMESRPMQENPMVSQGEEEPTEIPSTVPSPNPSLSPSIPVDRSPSGKAYSYYDSVKPTYIKGVLLVNKTYALPRSFGGNNEAASAALRELQAGARNAGYSMPLLSGYRSFEHQDQTFHNYVKKDGEAAANTYSAWPGHSEHQTGLAFDVGSIDDGFGNTEPGKWLADHAHEYGFIIRFPKGKEGITGYKYEPWHVRYLGVELATEVYQSGLCLEEFLFQSTPIPPFAPILLPQNQFAVQSLQ